MRSLTHAIIDRESGIPPWPSLEGQLRHFKCRHRPSSERQNPPLENPSTVELNCPPAGMSWFTGVTSMTRSQDKSSKGPLSRDTIRKDSDPHDIHTHNLQNQTAGPQFSSKATRKVDNPPTKQSIQYICKTHYGPECNIENDENLPPDQPEIWWWGQHEAGRQW